MKRSIILAFLLAGGLGLSGCGEKPAPPPAPKSEPAPPPASAPKPDAAPTPAPGGTTTAPTPAPGGDMKKEEEKK